MNQPISLPPFAAFTEGDLRETLSRMSRMESLRDSPLHDTAWVLSHALERRIDRAGVARDVLLADLLTGHISARYADVRGSSPPRIFDLAALEADFRGDDPELQRWSVLYHRYVRVEAGLSAEDIGARVSLSDRQVRRILTAAIRGMAHEIAGIEAGVRQTHRRDWLAQRLPPLGRPLHGRDAQIDALGDGWAAAGAGVTLLTGMGGGGKTALLAAVCLRLLDKEQVDDLIWIDAGSTPPAEWLGLTVATLGVPPAEQALGLAMQVSTMAGHRRVLAVVDGVMLEAAAVRELDRLAGLLPGGHVLASARTQPPNETAWRVINLPPLPDQAAHDVLDDLLLERGWEFNSVLRAEIVARAGGNPLLVLLLAERAHILPANRALALADAFWADEPDLLGDVWAVLRPDTRHLLGVLARLHPQPASWLSLQEQTSLPNGALDQALMQAARWHLIREMGPGGPYRLETALEPFVRARLTASPPPVLASSQSLLAMAEPVKRRGGWSSWRVMLESALPAGDEALPDPAVLLELGIAYRWLGEQEIAAHTLHRAIEIYGDTGAFSGQAAALLELGALEEELGHDAAALECYQRAADAAQRYDDLPLRMRALRGLASVLLTRHETGAAIEVLRGAMTLSGEEEPDGALISLMGMAHLRAGAVETAIQYHLRAVDLLTAAGDHPRLARARLRLGLAYIADHRPAEAAAQLRQAIQWMQMMGDVRGVARGLSNLGAMEQQQGQFETALDLWRSALDLQTQLSDGPGLAYTCYNLGDLLWHLNRPADAARYLSCALRYARQLALDALIPHLTTHPLYPDLTVSEEMPCPPMM